MIDAALFDVDGTLIDSNDLHAAAWRDAFRHFGADIPLAKVRGQIGKGGDNLIPALLSPDLVATLQDEIEAYRGALFQRDYLPRVTPFAGVRALFKRVVAAGTKIVLASSGKAVEVDFHIELIGCRDLVAATTTGDDVEHSKPDPDIFAAALAKAQVGADRAIVIGDTPYDMAAAGKIGIRAIGFRSGGFPDAELTAAGARELYDGPADLLARYEQSPLATG